MCKICHQLKCPPSCPNHIQKPMGQCKQCHTIITSDYPYWTDYDDHIFCSEECAKTYNKINEKDWVEDD